MLALSSPTVMRFAVQHDTLYRYSVPVVLAPHVLRLTPRPAETRVASRTLVVQPQPSELHEETDAFGNTVTRVSFAAVPSDRLRIESRFELDTLAAPPPATLALAPLPWPVTMDDELSSYRRGVGVDDPGVRAFAGTLAAEAGHQPIAFLDHLCRTLHARTDRHIRPSGDAQSPAETMATWRGACRDLTVLFLAMARGLGLPGRFVSGYQAAAETPDGQRHLHAWPEVFLSGVGWRGWDPTHGVPAGEGHVALCAAPDQADTMPVVGGYFFGSSITATLDYEVRIRTGSREPRGS
jgi:transglutaminase-like putative cysteine protease